METFNQKLLQLQTRFGTLDMGKVELLRQKIILLLRRIRTIGFVRVMDEYEKRKLGVFNLLNFLQLVTGITVPLIGLVGRDHLPGGAIVVACLPALVSIVVLVLNYYQKYETALFAYFILHPFCTCLLYLNGMNLGVDLSFILYGILSVFFLREISHMLFTVGFSMISYFVLAVVRDNYQYQLASANMTVYLFNQILCIGFIYYGLYLIKKENSGYQFRMIMKSKAIHNRNVEIQKQKSEIDEKARLLKKQTEELTELNSLKNKLFSVISHDLKTPMYALRNLFRNVEQYNVPAEEIKTMIPDVVNDLNYTVGLMENLLQWAKTQMEAHSIRNEALDVSKLINDVLQLLHLQAEAKKIYVENKHKTPVYVYADKDMVNLVLRNLVSNAIKFTPEEGKVSIGVNELSSFVEIYVKDTGMGISAEALQKINENNYYTTKGTASESGTGLGLMLCKEFLAKSGGQMHIESKPGKGSTFSFTLPRPKK